MPSALQILVNGRRMDAELVWMLSWDGGELGMPKSTFGLRYSKPGGVLLLVYCFWPSSGYSIDCSFDSARVIACVICNN